ncbi:hypothetical protein FN846DRAFT_776890 [Sphaerosporella brunnea]|uniref:Methyltransferase domain-containing protein n=1 Tax=Sphaerosporella brunnea TaxID=1250544 RepID=A0A5J5EZN3_9PEZI|nr:hypothetical protein FN846DRAFT_776890 [Sphaerosporella brunnea]
MSPIPNSPASRPRKRTSTPTHQQPTFVTRNGRKFYNDETSPYPLPCDVKEMSRQALWHELHREVYGSYSNIDWQSEKIPSKVLELGCGSAIWSASMADYFASLGHPNVEFTGLDVVQSYTDMKNVNFKFVKHSILIVPLPFEDNTFDYIMSRDMMLAAPTHSMYTGIMAELIRVLKPGGFVEVQCNDFVIRTIQRTTIPYANKVGTYDISSSVQLSSNSENPFIQQWNEKIQKAFLARNLPPVPCTVIGPVLVQEDSVIGVQTKRLALPLDSIWWESASDSASETSSSDCSRRRSTGESSLESLSGPPKQQFRKRRGSAAQSHHYSTRRSSTSADSYMSPLNEEERAVRHLGKLAFVQLIEALEGILREHNDMDLDEWDSWYRDLMWNWFEGQGLRGGECLEFGAWWGRKSPE